MKNKFVPYFDKIQIEPIESDSWLGVDSKKPEVGKVVAVGKDVKFCKVGDTLMFADWGFKETTEIEGKIYCVVSEHSQFILGKITHGSTK